MHHLRPWPLGLFYILIGFPILIFYACLCKGVQVDASRGFRFIVPQNCYLLYDRCTGAIEAPVTAALLVMLLVVGVRRENGYVISYPQVLYASLFFSIVHMLLFWWDMVHIATTSLSWREWWGAFKEPFNLASVKTPLSPSESVTNAAAVNPVSEVALTELA